jgi:hypothetical protein
MTKRIYEWSTTPGNNDFAPAEGGWMERMSRSDVNNAARENLAATRMFYNDMEWQTIHIRGPEVTDVATFARTGTYTFRLELSGYNMATFFPVGRRLQIANGGGAGVALFTKVVTKTYSDPYTTVTVEDAIDPAANYVYVYAMKSLGDGAFGDGSGDFHVPETNDSAGITAAVAACVAAGGGTVYLPAGTYTITTAINISTTVNVPFRMIGAGKRTILQRSGSPTYIIQALGFMNTHFALRDFAIVNTGGADAAIFIGAAFGGADISGISITGGRYGVTIQSYFDVHFDRCLFASQRQHAIRSLTGPAIYGFEVGSITNCVFSLASTSVAYTDSAYIKVAGPWSIVGNDFINMGHNSYTHKGVWLWNASTPTNGGWKCRVIGNQFDGGAATQTVTAVEVGSHYTTVSGNMINVSTVNGIGVHLRHTTGSNYVEDPVISGNSIRSQVGISITRYVRNASVTGNSIHLSSGGTGIATDAQASCTFSGNTIRGGNTGFLATSNSLRHNINGNAFVDQVLTAISLLAGTDNVASGNVVRGSPTAAIAIGVSSTNAVARENDVGLLPVSSASTTSVRNRNGRVAREIWYHNGTDSRVPASGLGVPEAMTLYTALPLPGNGGQGEYKIRLGARANGSNTQMDVRVGSTGGVADASIATYNGFSWTAVRHVSGRQSVTDSGGGTSSFALDADYDQSMSTELFVTVTNDTWLYVGLTCEEHTSTGSTGTVYAYWLEVEKVSD